MPLWCWTGSVRWLVVFPFCRGADFESLITSDWILCVFDWLGPICDTGHGRRPVVEVISFPLDILRRQFSGVWLSCSSGVRVNLFKSAVGCVAVLAICGCDRAKANTQPRLTTAVLRPVSAIQTSSGRSRW